MTTFKVNLDWAISNKILFSTFKSQYNLEVSVQQDADGKLYYSAECTPEDFIILTLTHPLFIEEVLHNE